MDKEQVKKIIDSTEEYDESNEDTYRSILRDFLSKKMRWVMINFYVWFSFFTAVCITSIILFFKTDNTQYQIMYAAIFICCFLTMGVMKVIGYVIISRYNLRREIKRLELRIAELTEVVKNK